MSENGGVRIRTVGLLTAFGAMITVCLAPLADVAAAQSPTSTAVPESTSSLGASTTSAATTFASSPSTVPTTTLAATGQSVVAPAPTATIAAPSSTPPVSSAPAPTVAVVVGGPAGPPTSVVFGVPSTIAVPAIVAVPTTSRSTVVGPPLPATTAITFGPTTTLLLRPAFSTNTLSLRSKGDAVLALEQRLEQLRYDVGTVDGRFDWQTWQGVVAFQKVNGLKRTGKASVETQQLIASAEAPGALIPSGGKDRIEVDIARQVLFLFRQNALYKVVAISSGSGRRYCATSKKTQAETCGDARTPRGNFKIQRRIPGWRESDLGKLYNPLYFNGGFAIHGAPSVPAGPASHGCVRIPMGVAEWFPDEVANGMPVYVFD